MLNLLEDAWVFVHLDPRREGVVLPAHLRQQKRVVLQYGYNMPVPIEDFKVDEKGIWATLSFQRQCHATFVPWSAVFALTDGDKRTLVWEEDLPADLNLSEEAQAEAPPKPAPEPPAKPGKRPRPAWLKLVD